MPDLEAVGGVLDEVAGSVARATRAASLSKEAFEADRRRTDLEDRIGRMPDLVKVAGTLDAAAKACVKAVRAAEIAEEAGRILAQRNVLEDRLEDLAGLDAAEKALGRAVDALERMGKVSALTDVFRVSCGDVEALETKLAEVDRERQDAERERDEILASVKTCPLTLRPVRPECLEVQQR
jgi:chromosome segregation ATPase